MGRLVKFQIQNSGFLDFQPAQNTIVPLSFHSEAFVPVQPHPFVLTTPCSEFEPLHAQIRWTEGGKQKASKIELEPRTT